MWVKTAIDDFVGELLSGGGFRGAIEKSGLPERTAYDLLEVLEEKGLARVRYPLLPGFSPWVEILVGLRPPPSFPFDYEISSDDGHFRAGVKIEGRNYLLDLPETTIFTTAFLETVKEKVARVVPPEAFVRGDREKERKALALQCEVSERELEKVAGPEEVRLLCGRIRAEMYGLGPLEYLLYDPDLEEVVVNGARRPVIVYHRKRGWLKTNLSFDSEAEIQNYASRVGRRVGRQLAFLTPLLDAHLPSGERVNATLFPISLSGNTLTLRKFSEEPYTPAFLISNGTMDLGIASLLWQAVEYEMNLLIVGGTASGKTTLLNAILMFLPNDQRVITIEDTREVNLPPLFQNWVPLVARPPNPEGLGEVSLLDLMVTSLRMRPDRIVIGEVRKREEVQVMFEAMHTGHSVYATFHADTAYAGVRRLTEEPLSVPLSELEILDLVVALRRHRRTNVRRILEIAEVRVMEKGFELFRSFRYSPREDGFEFLGLPLRYREKMSLYSGMDEKEMEQDLKRRQEFLKDLMKKKVLGMREFAAWMEKYYEGMR